MSNDNSVLNTSIGYLGSIGITLRFLKHGSSNLIPSFDTNLRHIASSLHSSFPDTGETLSWKQFKRATGKLIGSDYRQIEVNS